MPTDPRPEIESAMQAHTAAARKLVRADDHVHKSGAGFWHVWKLTHSFGVYNQNGVKIAEVFGHSERNLEMAKMIADAFDNRWQL